MFIGNQAKQKKKEDKMANLIPKEKLYEVIGKEFIETYNSLPGGTNKKVTSLVFNDLLDKVGLTRDVLYGATSFVDLPDGSRELIFDNVIKNVRKAYDKRYTPNLWSDFDKKYNEIIARMEAVNKGAGRNLFTNTFSVLNDPIYVNGTPESDLILDTRLATVLSLDRDDLVAEKESWSIAQKSLFFGGALAIGGAIYYFKK